MDKMNTSREIDAAIREVAAVRDKALRKVPTLSSGRRAALAHSLAQQFPIEAALRELAADRDSAIHRTPATIPTFVESILNRQLANAERTSAEGPATFWLNRLRLPLAAVLILCALLAVALPRFRGGEGASRRDPRNFTPEPAIVQSDSRIVLDGFAGSRGALFARQLALSSLNLNTNEPASLQLSFLANSLRFADGNERPPDLRLDLPVKVALTEDGLARTP